MWRRLLLRHAVQRTQSQHEIAACNAHNRPLRKQTLECPERGRIVRATLEEAGLKPEYHEFRMGHQITAESLAVVSEFIARTVPPAETVERPTD